MSLTAEEVVHLVARLSQRDRRLAAAMRGREAMDEPPAMEQILVKATDRLSDQRVPYAVVGSLAVAIHVSLPRATRAADIAVASMCDRERVIESFARAGFTLRGRFEHSVNLVHGSGDPVQLAFDPSFDVAIARAETFSLAGREIRIVRREDLIALKERAAADPGRRRSKALRDRADVEMLRGDVPDPDEGW